MPRVVRIKSNSGIYHIIMRGINRQTLFEDEEDYVKFVQTMQKYKEMCEYKIYAYCLMGNHLHLLLKEGKEPLKTVATVGRSCPPISSIQAKSGSSSIPPMQSRVSIVSSEK